MHSLLSLLILAQVAYGQTWTVGQAVKTTSGTVTGKGADWKPEVSVYLGIPFAESPVGKLRFAAPVAFKGSSSINATKFGLGCPENVGGKAETMKEVGDDCLNLNIWTKPQSGEKAKAVMVSRQTNFAEKMMNADFARSGFMEVGLGLGNRPRLPMMVLVLRMSMMSLLSASIIGSMFMDSRKHRLLRL